MGNEASLPGDMVTHFDADEIRRLGKRFRKLDLDKSGALSVEEFMSLPELQQNPLVQRVIDIFDTDGNGEVDFKVPWWWCSTCTFFITCAKIKQQEQQPHPIRSYGDQSKSRERCAGHNCQASQTFIILKVEVVKHCGASQPAAPMLDPAWKSSGGTMADSFGPYSSTVFCHGGAPP
ncbi:hypothetical protein ACROYT_G040999 [Oculina patagonica]